MSVENMASFNVRMKPSLWKEAKAFAEQDGNRISDVVRDLIKEYVERKRQALNEQQGD